MNAFESLCDTLESECDNEMYTLSNLHDMMCDLVDSQEESRVYGKEYLKNLLKSKYGSHIYFASRPGRDDVVGFSNFCDLLLHDKFFSEKNEDKGSTEAERILQKAADLILSEIRELECHRDFYPTPNDINSDGMKFVQH